MSPAGTACSYEVKEFKFSVVSAAVSPADCLPSGQVVFQDNRDERVLKSC